MSVPYRIERLAKQDRRRFDCGVGALNTYLQKQAGQEERRRIAACYLLIEQASAEIIGYYTLSAGSVLLADLPEEAAKRLPRYPTVPVARIGRVAIAIRFQGQKLGGVLLFDAIQRAAMSELGIHAIAVDAKDEAAVSFYKHHGFVALPSAPRTLLLAVAEGLKQIGGSPR